MEPTAVATATVEATKAVTVMDTQTLLWIGSAVVVSVGFLLKWFFDRLTKVVDNRLAKRERDEEKFRKEQEEETIHEMHGRQITCDCLHELIYAVLHNEHNGGLERVSEELERYREENDKLIMKKAARYNLKVN